MAIRRGNPEQLGATLTEDGCFFAVFSSTADFVELCLFDDAGNATMNYRLPGRDGDIHHGFLPGIAAGQRYGYRAHGTWAPDRGLRHNPAKLLLDPYARELSGRFRWHPSVFDTNPHDVNLPDRSDSADFVPRAVVLDAAAAETAGPSIPWAETIVYETNVRGFSMRHPALDEQERGRFAGMSHGAVLAYLKALGVTSIELMPVQAWIDERHLADNGLRNAWGYNTIAFMAPMPRLARQHPTREFRHMVRALHDAGFEVILDVAFNHTGEGDANGPTLSFRGFDNLAYYRTSSESPASYINDTGTGNTINADHPAVQTLVVDSLKHWVTLGADGFRFDLGPVLGRQADGFRSNHPLLTAITTDPQLRNTKLIAEPWDPGPGGYQLGAFPRGWAEWNDRYRDTVRRFWRGDDKMAGDFARRLHGSADVFDSAERKPWSSVNFVAAHDGFTLLDAVSYEHRHNEANGEDNRDGHAHNYSMNYGIEGPTDDETVNEQRRRHRLNMLATLFLSQGTPMLLAGDEFGHTQGGNNNAYAQDNATSWLDWRQADDDPAFVEAVRRLIALRKRSAGFFSAQRYLRSGAEAESDEVSIDWLNCEGDSLAEHEWRDGRAKLVLLEQRTGSRSSAIALVINGESDARRFRLPSSTFQLLFATVNGEVEERHYLAAAASVAVLSSD